MKYVVENLFGIDGWNIAWYGVIIACGMILGVILASVRARQDGLKSDMLLDFMLFGYSQLGTWTGDWTLGKLCQPRGIWKCGV